MEANMQVLEGAQYRLRVKLTNVAGEKLPPELFRVYAGAFCPGYAPAHFHAERTEEEWLLTMPGLKPGRVPWNWQVIAAEYATGVEWLLAAGEVTVTPRHATGSGCVDPGELKIVATLDKTTLQMTVQVGESTAACSLAVVDARNSAKAADASAKAAAGSASYAAEQAQAAETARQLADGSAKNAAGSADDAHEQATAADTSATNAANSARAAAGEATKAAAEVEKAKQESATAAGHATAAGKSAQDALANQQGAGQAARDAAQSQVAATAAKNDADAAKLAAQTSERNAKASEEATAADKEAAEQAKTDALAAQTKAEQEAQKAADNAARLGDAALKSANNVFSGANVFNGAISGSGTLCGLPFGSAFGLASALQGVSLSPEEFFMLFPDHKNMEVWPGLDNPTDPIKYEDMPKVKHIFMYLKKNYYVAVPDVPINEYGEAVVYHSGNGWIQAGCIAQKARNIFVFPEYNTSYNDRYLNITIGNTKTEPEVFLYMPKNQGIRFTWQWFLSPGAKIVFLGSQVYKSIKGFDRQDRCEIPVTIKGFNSPNCELVFLPWAGLDKDSILELVGSLPTYDAETMTEVPACTLYVRPEYEGDEEITAALLNLQTAVEDGGKGWTLAVNGATLTQATTFGLRRFMYLLRERSDSGDYVDAEGYRWDVRGGQTVLRNFVANEQLGYEAFASLEDALEYWGLTEYQPEEAIDD